jgi:hypothetical protein
MAEELRQETRDACETIDSAIFTGDEFVNRAARLAIRENIRRWIRGLNDHAANEYARGLKGEGGAP